MKLKVRLFWVVILTVGLFVAWHSSLLSSLLRPTLVHRGFVSLENTKPQTDILVYESLGISAPISVNAGTSPLVQADWSVIRESLMHGVSLAYTDSTFDDSKLAFITGHSSDTTRHPFDSVFAPLGQAKVGDKFQVFLSDTQYDYQVISRQTIAPTNTEEFLALGSKDEAKRVALVTCWPPLTTKTRMVVVGQRL